MTKCKPTPEMPKPFLFEGSTRIRVVVDEAGEPWFVAQDIAHALEYRMASDLTRLLKPHHLRTHAVRTNRGERSATIISEPAMYRAVFLSKSKKAEPFQEWVTSDVLRSIRKTGAYGVPMAAIRQAVAERFLGVGLAPYAKRFPTPFYEGIFRLRGWPWHGPGTPRPGVIAYWTNDLVYERLAPELLRLLRERNPMDKDTGRRAAKHHQLLSEDIGHPALAVAAKVDALNLPLEQNQVRVVFNWLQ
ncbi:anti-repressor Ant [Myxococcus phage Mx8]|uniref:p63 n=1 Tax=Myxococcus phage Mx8 TaxID=49964 RepID=Q94MQ6_9CAUD|nr:anti-repressor Ant [Myxococcus phage Mx8]AAK94398.1 p63 [Myxococcus phage Mx8]